MLCLELNFLHFAHLSFSFSFLYAERLMFWNFLFYYRTVYCTQFTCSGIHHSVYAPFDDINSQFAILSHNCRHELGKNFPNCHLLLSNLIYPSLINYLHLHFHLIKRIFRLLTVLDHLKEEFIKRGKI